MPRIIFNERLLCRATAHAGIDGSRRIGKFTDREALYTSEDRQGHLVPADDVHARLLEAVGGCLNTANLVTRLLLGEINAAVVARELGWNRTSMMKRLRRILAALKAPVIARTAWEAVLKTDRGCTVDPRRCTAVEPVKSIWAVSLKGHERAYRKRPTVAQMTRYLSQHWSALQRSSDGHLGVWFDSKLKIWYLDVTILVSDRDDALTLARANAQRCIVDLFTHEELWL